jgi:hypothetical protein
VNPEVRADQQLFKRPRPHASCYRLYTLCERKKRATEALAYNSLVQSWPEITRLAREGGNKPRAARVEMFEEEIADE